MTKQLPSRNGWSIGDRGPDAHPKTNRFSASRNDIAIGHSTLAGLHSMIDAKCDKFTQAGCRKPCCNQQESVADDLIQRQLGEEVPLYHGLTGQSFPTAQPKTDAEIRAHTDDRDLNMAWDFDDHAAAHAKAQQLANIHHREIGITQQPSGKHRVHHLSGMESRHFVSKSDQRVSPNTHADGSLIKDEDVVKYGDLKPGERFRFFQSKGVNTKVSQDGY